jgi:hypothetical protein
LIGGYFKEAFNKENATYEKTKVCELKGKCLTMFYLWVFFVLFSSFMFLLCMQIFIEEDNVDFGIGEVGVVLLVLLVMCLMV